MSFKQGVDPIVFRAIQNVDMSELNQCTEQQIRPVLPCLVRMGLISPLDTSKQCTNMKIDILTIVSGMELVNSIVALLSIDFHRLEIDVKKEQQLRSKTSNNNNCNNNNNNNSNNNTIGGNNNNNNTVIQDSILIGNLTNTSMALEYERSDMTRRLSILLGELLYIQSQIQDNNYSNSNNLQDTDNSNNNNGNTTTTNNNNNTNYIKSSELFDNDIFAEELSDIICIALAELPITLNILQMVETLLHLHNGPAIICRIVANFPDCFREVSTYLIQTGEKQEETILSTVRAQTIQLLCKMNPSQALTIRSKCIELCRMPALAITLTLEFNNNNIDDCNDIVAFISGLLLGNDQTIRNWIALFIRTGQKKKGEISSLALQQLRQELLKYLQTIINKSNQQQQQQDDKLVVKGSAILRLYCALRGIAGIKFQEDEINAIVKLLTIHPPATQSGVRFVSIGLCMLIACPSLITVQEHERKCIEWVQWLVKEEVYFETQNQYQQQSSFGEMLLLMAIHFHSNQLSAICDLVCSILGMKIPIRHNNMTRMKQVFIQEIFTEQIVTAHSVKVPVTKQLNATMLGFLPIHCIHQLLKSRAFIKYNVNIKNWIYKQICTSTKPLHPVLPLLIEVYVNNIILPTNTVQQQQQQNLQQQQQQNKPLDEQEIRYVFENSIFGQYFIKKKLFEQHEIYIDNTSLTPQLLLLYYLLLYEDCRLNNAQILTNLNRKIKIYNSEFLSELPIKYLLHHAQKDQQSYNGLFGPLLKLLTTHFPHLTLIDDWLDDMSTLSIINCDKHGNNNNNDDNNGKIMVNLNELQLIDIFDDIDKNPLKCARLLQNFLKQEPINIWKYCEIFIKFIKNFLNCNIPRYLQDLYKDVWLRFNTVLPRRLWVLTIKYLVDDFTNLTRIDVAEDPLQILRCDERVFRCAPIFTIVLRVLRASLASSRSQLLQHLQANPRLDTNGQIINENDREEMCRATIAAQESAAVQMLLETCLETENDRCIGGQQWALQEVRSLVCSYLHQVFIADTMLAKLVHFQGYPCELIEVIVKGVPSMHICLDFLQELMQQPSLNKQIFAIQLLSHLSIQYALPKSLNLCVTALNLLYALLGSVSSSQRVKLFKPILPSLVRISEAFPPLVDDIVNLLMQLAKICESQATLTSHFDVQSSILSISNYNKGLEISSLDSRELCYLVQKTFSDILDKAVLKTQIYKQQ